MPIENTKLIKHQKHRHKLHDQTHTIRQGTNIIYKTNQSNQRHPNQKPRILKSKENTPNPNSDQEYDTATTQNHLLMRTAFVRFVDNVEMVGDAEVEKFDD